LLTIGDFDDASAAISKFKKEYENSKIYCSKENKIKKENRKKAIGKTKNGKLYRVCGYCRYF